MFMSDRKITDTKTADLLIVIGINIHFSAPPFLVSAQQNINIQLTVRGIELNFNWVIIEFNDISNVYPK